MSKPSEPELEFFRWFLGPLIGVFVVFGLGYSWLWAFAAMYKLAFYFHFLP